MPDYANASILGKTLYPAVNLSGVWSLRRRLQWTWDQNPNHVSGSHAKRRKQLERRYERAEKIRMNLVQALRAEIARDPDAVELEAWARDLALLTPEAVGAILDPAAIGPGGAKRQAWYLPDVTLPLASIMIRLAKLVMKALKYAGRRKLLDHVKATANLIARSLARPSLPQSVPPQTPEENRKVKDSSEPTAIKEELASYIAKLQAKQPVEYRPPAGEAVAAAVEAR